MKKIIFLFVFIGLTKCLAQTKIEGSISDKATNEPLPYATIKIYGAETYYTITNEDGKFEIDTTFSKDSLEVRHLGFISQKIAVSYFEKNPTLSLELDVSVLDEVILTASQDKEYPLKLLFNIIDKYRKQNETTSSKTFLTLTSSIKDIPLEQIEGFYNSEQSLSKGIIDLRVKSGRFGQNKSFAYYSLDNTKILNDFQLFETSKQILPNYPGNMSLASIKRKYDIHIDTCTTCNEGEVLVSFSPKKNNGRLFYGKMLLNHNQLVIKKIELVIKDPNTASLASINQNVSLTPKEIKLSVVFNPIDFEKIQYLDFSFQMNYQFESFSEIIDSRTFLYFYEYDSSFEEPYFTQEISFNNDYDKMIALQASDDFWVTNYQFPKSFNDKKSMDYMKENGYLINYENYIPINDLEYINPSVLSWRKDKRLTWDHLLQDTPMGNEKNFNTASRSRELDTGTSYDSPLDLYKANNKKTSKNKLDVSYLIDSFEDREGNEKIESRCLVNINASHFNVDRTKNRLVYFNIIFDTYEVYRQLAASKITDEMSFDQVKSTYQDLYKAAATETKKIENETNLGTSYNELIKWNYKIKAQLHIDNFNFD